jgi:RNA polymerase sigma factor (sigma-70 family)
LGGAVDRTFLAWPGSKRDVQDHSKLDELARLAARGDEDSLNRLLHELGPTIVRAVRLIVGAGGWEAEEAAQEALLDISRGLRDLREPKAVRAWAAQVATRRALKIASRRRRLPDLLFSATPSFHVDPADRRMPDLKRAFDRLPPRMRAIAVLRLYVGMSEAETAEAVGCAVGTVKSQLHEARARLAAYLDMDRTDRQRSAREGS